MDELLTPRKLWRSEEIVGARPSPVPAAPGVYAWYFRQTPGAIDIGGCHIFNGMPMLYVGIAPKAPYADGRRSKTTLRQRMTYHYNGNAEGSTLRLTLGCLLAEQLGIELRRVGSGKRRTFSAGEALLTSWMAENAFACWTQHPEPWALEEELIAQHDLALNLDQNKRNNFHAHLSAARRAAKERAAQLPILPR
jgi:hypothetical protein